MAKRKGISKKTRFEVFKRDSFTCQYCGRSAPEVVLHVDHIQPVSKEGEDDILNLLTSCFDCNMGKKDRLLSDSSALTKQKLQLDELNERREQIEMMLEWRSNLKEFEEDVIDIAIAACDKLTPGWSIHDDGRRELRKLIKKFGIETVLHAIDESANYLKRKKDGQFTNASVNEAFNRLGGICRTLQQPDWKRELYYIRGIMRKRFAYVNDWQAIQFMENAYDDGVPLEDLRELAVLSRNWTKWVEGIVALRTQYRG